MPVMPSSPLRITPWLALGLLVLAGCFRETTGESGGPARPRYTGSAPWTIDGVRPGDTFDGVKARLGEQGEVREYSGIRTATWKFGQLTVSFDRTGRATDVSGQSIRAGDDTLITAGTREAEVVQVLGAGKVQKGFMPGSGVISLGSTHTSTIHLYDSAGVRFEVSVQFPEDSVTHLWARLPDPKPLLKRAVED